MLITSCVSCSRIPNKINNLLESKYYKSVALLQSTPGAKGYAGGSATGFAIDEDHIASAGHFCTTIKELLKKEEAGNKIMVVRSSKKGLPLTPILGDITAIHSTKDICIIRSPEHGMEPLLLADSVDSLNTEDNITVIGAPRGFFPIRREGRIISSLAYRFHQFSDMLFIAVNIEAGNSGSPVIKDGEVFGMVVIQPSFIHETALAVPVDEIREFVSKTIGK